MGEERERGREEGVITGQNGGVFCVKSFFFWFSWGFERDVDVD